MKTYLFSRRLAAACGLAAISTLGFAATVHPVPARLAAADQPSPVVPAPDAAQDELDAASARWADIKDVIFDQRADFFAGLKRLEAKVGQQVRELTARREAMNGFANTKDWDFAMKEMGNARTSLAAMGVEAGKASPETWDQAKDKVGQAWLRTQEAYAKVKSSTTT